MLWGACSSMGSLTWCSPLAEGEQIHNLVNTQSLVHMPSACQVLLNPAHLSQYSSMLLW